MLSWEEVAKKLESELKKRKGRRVIIQECDVELLCEYILELLYYREGCKMEELDIDTTPITLLWIKDECIAIDCARLRCWFIQLM